MKVLLATDGSRCARQAVGYVIRHAKDFGRKPEIHLLNVQPPLPARVAGALGRSIVERYHRDEAVKALAPARRALDARGIRYRQVCLIGDPGKTIAAYAKNGQFSVAILGSHGQGALSSFVLGSVVRKVLARCRVPVLIAR